jgi:hypothetical protein
VASATAAGAYYNGLAQSSQAKRVRDVVG